MGLLKTVNIVINISWRLTL